MIRKGEGLAFNMAKCQKKCKNGGRAIYNPFAGYIIAMNIPYCSDMHDKGLWVIDHECAHIASTIKHKDWRHGERFHWMYAACRKRNQA